ncbi:hypothetical protein B0O99DRAFT_516875 [Bisporella sp. PMI_857]|nr:hypothetical protein B0O99DRAFT_516875 [Bisporella sp. PMI_857]
MATLSLPHRFIINGFSYIPPRSAKAFEEEFAWILLLGQDVQSSWGVIHYYDFSTNTSPDARKMLLIHGGGPTAMYASISY